MRGSIRHLPHLLHSKEGQRYLGTLIACLGLFFSGGSFGQSADEVKTQLQLIQLLAIDGGWVETHDEKFDQLNNGQTDSFTFTLEKGKSYKVVSVCDKDCSDLDLALYDEHSNLISRDDEKDGMPIVEVSPRWTGKFQLKVSMYSCSNNPCGYGIGILGR